MEKELVTVRELAEILFNNPQAEAAVERELTNDGIPIVEDWAGRRAVALSQAKRKVGTVVKARREAQAAYDHERAIIAAAQNAQRDRNQIAADEFMRALRANGGDRKKAAKAATHAIAVAEKDLPREVRARLTMPNVGGLMPYNP